MTKKARANTAQSRARKRGSEGKPISVPDYVKNEDGHISRAVGGSYDIKFNTALLNDVIRTFWAPSSGPYVEEWNERSRTEAIIGLVGIRPRTELEGMLAAQMIAAHAATLECYRRAALSEQTYEGRVSNLNLAAKASRTFATLTESLQRLRGETGKQTVHVHHHTDARTQVAANQAVVNVGGKGEGKNEKADQPHEPKAISHEPTEPVDLSAPLRREESARETVPGSGDAWKETMPFARRQKSRSA